MTDDPKTMAAELRDIADLLDEYEEFRFAPSDLRRIAAYLDTLSAPPEDEAVEHDGSAP